MPPLRSRNHLGLGHVSAPRLQCPTPTVITAHFLRQIEANHIRTPGQGRPVPLHFNPATKSLSEWGWPINVNTDHRVPPSELESFRRTHRFRAPCCLCPLLEGSKAYVESRIGIVETVTNDQFRNQSVLNGEYVATCAKQRCGFFLCLERFYPLIFLKIQVCNPRSLEKVHPDCSKKYKDALVNELADGMSEVRFWATFVQCFVCKAVTLRKHFAAGHTCGGEKDAGRPYPRPALVDDEVPSSPTSTVLEETEDHDYDPPTDADVFGDVEYVLMSPFNENPQVPEGDHEAPVVDVPQDITDDSDLELPTILEVMHTVPMRVVGSRGI